jgi:hypothetical protein
VKRRWLRGLLSGGVASLRFARGRAWAQPASSAPAPAGLEALARVVLPAVLGPEGRSEVLLRFRGWLRGYEAGAEMDHGYGHTRLQVAGPHPARDYQAQLAALDTAARAEGRTDFAHLEAARQQALLGEALARAGIEALPERPDGRHVAADLMAFFFRSSEANDLCYGAAIGRDQCRGLPGSEAAPEPLPRKGQG